MRPKSARNAREQDYNERDQQYLKETAHAVGML
jgi:hypothetical protein